VVVPKPTWADHMDDAAARLKLQLPQPRRPKDGIGTKVPDSWYKEKQEDDVDLVVVGAWVAAAIVGWGAFISTIFILIMN
jgi:hypothetical protein